MRVGRWLLAIVSMLGCVSAIPPLPGRGGPAWVELQSEHFTLWTNASARRGREIVRELERRRDIITRAMNRASFTTHAFVIALRETREVEVYTGPGFAGIAWSEENPTGMPAILMSANPRNLAETVTHELTHLISFGIVKNQPRWLAEGIASYFETADLNADASSVQIGRPRSDYAHLIRRFGLLPVSNLLFGCKGPCVNSVYYATSWVLFSYLLNEHYDRLGHYLARLNELSHKRYDEVWREVFPDLRPEELDIKLASWIRIGEIRLPRIQVTVRDIPLTTRSLGDADVLAVRGLLGIKTEQETATVRADLDAALAIDPTNLLAHLVEADLTRSIAPDVARAVAAAHPDDWRAWGLVELALRGTDEGSEALSRLCSLSANAAAACTPAPAR